MAGEVADSMALCCRIQDYDVDGARYDDADDGSVCEAWQKLYGALHRGGQRTCTVDAAIQCNDVRTVIKHYQRDRADTTVLTDLLKLCTSWLSDMAEPFRDDDVAATCEERACNALFHASLGDVRQGNELVCVVEEKRQSDTNLIDATIQRVRETMQIIRYGFGQVDEIVKGETEGTFAEFSADKFDDVQVLQAKSTETLRKACDQVESYRSSLNALIRSMKALSSDVTEEKCALYNFLTTDDIVNYHARLIFDWMYANDIKRYMRTTWAPAGERTSFAAPRRTIPNAEQCSGFYKQYEMEKEVVPLLFDEEARRIIGPVSDYFNDRHVCTRALPEGVDPSKIRVAIQCNGRCAHAGGDELCCDLYHTKCKADKWVAHGGTWNNPTQVDISKLPAHRGGHCFEPKCVPVAKPFMTRGYYKYADVDDMLNWWFSCQHSEEAQMDALANASLKPRIAEFFKNAALPDNLTLVPNDYVYMFADGYLVCDYKLVDAPTFYQFDSVEFTTGEFRNIDTTNVHIGTVFRRDEYEQALIKVREARLRPNPRTGEVQLICNHCGCSYAACQAWQGHFTATLDRGRGVTMDDIRRWHRAQARAEDAATGGAGIGDPAFFETLAAVCAGNVHAYPFTRTDVDGTVVINADYEVFRHAPDVYPPLRRQDGTEIAAKLDLGVVDDVILFQYDWRKPWEELPESLRDVDRDDGRFYASQLPRIRNEILFHWGRCNYRQSEYENSRGRKEGFQVMLMTIGTANTGKSATLDFVKRCMDPVSIGVIDCATFEEKFGMQMVFDKRFIVMNEVQTDSKTFSTGLFKQCCDQSTMSIPVKNKEAKVGAIQAHLWFLGNERLFSFDPAGALSRRLALIRWDREVPKHIIDPQLQFKFNLHFGHFVAAMFASYWGMLEAHADHDFWYKEGNSYPMFSWVWHRQRELGETTASKLKSALASFEASSFNWCFSPHDAVSGFVPPTTQNVGGECRLARPDRDNGDATNDDWFDDQMQSKPAIAYMPFENLNEDSGMQCSGFKTLHLEKLKAMGGKISVNDVAWDRGLDFFGKDFERAGIRHIERKCMPWPPWSDVCITSDWVLGCAAIGGFKDESSVLNPAWYALERRAT